MLVVFFNHRLTPRMSAIHCLVPVWHQVLMRMFCRLFACLLSLLVRRCVRSECVWSVFSHHVFLPAQSLFQPVHLAESEINNIQLSPLHTRITFSEFPYPTKNNISRCEVSTLLSNRWYFHAAFSTASGSLSMFTTNVSLKIPRMSVDLFCNRKCERM